MSTHVWLESTAISFLFHFLNSHFVLFFLRIFSKLDEGVFGPLATPTLHALRHLVYLGMEAELLMLKFVVLRLGSEDVVQLLLFAPHALFVQLVAVVKRALGLA